MTRSKTVTIGFRADSRLAGIINDAARYDACETVSEWLRAVAMQAARGEILTPITPAKIIRPFERFHHTSKCDIRAAFATLNYEPDTPLTGRDIASIIAVCVSGRYDI